MTQLRAHQNASIPTRLASQIRADLNRIHAGELTPPEGEAELARVAEALDELRNLKASRNETDGLLASLPILAVAFGRKHGIKVRIGGALACTDGQSIQLPTLPMGSPHVLRSMVLGYLYHETGHIETTDMVLFTAAARESELIRNLLNVIEDIRMEAWRNAKYPGSASVLRDLAGVLQAEGQFGTVASAQRAHPAHLLAMSILTTLRAQELNQPVQAIASIWRQRAIEQFGEALALKIDVITAGAAQLKSTREALAMARHVAKVLKEEHERQEANEPSKSGQSGEGDTESEPGSSDAGQSGESESDGADPGDSAETSAGADPTNASAGQSGESGSSDADASGSSSSADSGATSPVSPEQHQALGDALTGDQDAFGKTDLGDIMKEILESEARDAVKAERTENPGMGGVSTPNNPEVGRDCGFNELAQVAEASQKLRVRLAAKLQADARRRRSHLDQGQRLDGHVLHRLFVNDPRLFLRKEIKRDVNTAIQVLLDRSSSMEGREIAIARQATLAVALGLGQIPRVKTAACAFPDLLILKQWEERVQQVANRFPLPAAGTTPMAQAMLWGAANLAARREERKLMIVITDGAPDDRAAVETLVRKLSQSKVECIAVGIGTDYVKHLFPVSVVINGVDELVSALFDVVGRRLTDGRMAA